VDYWVSIQDQCRGPYTLDQLRSMWGTGQLTADTYYFTPSTAQWQALRQLFEPHLPPLPVKTANEDDRLRAVLEKCRDGVPRGEVSVSPRQGPPSGAHLFTFKGRSGRWEFFLMSIVYTVIYAGLDTVLVSATGAGANTLYDAPGWVFLCISGLLVGYVWCMTTLVGRRFHDMNASAWFSTVAFVPLLNAGLLLYLLLRPGTDGPNDYGER
jgi:uncharacterized membrane protein YhaH (DUF805 family)